MRITLHEKEPGIPVVGLDHLDQIIANAIKRAKDQNILSIIFLTHENDNSLGIVVGGDETVLSFTYNHQEPPYYASKGAQKTNEPIITCFLLFEHHTEFLRKLVIPFTVGLTAAREFYNSGNLPSCIEWVEV